jgi:microsomal epoxide hydrolase
MAEVNAKLMAQLGYAKYGAQGGDWGAIISVQNALVDQAHCAGIHLNMVVAFPPGGMTPEALAGVTPEEGKDLADLGSFQANETGYQQIQGTKPQTLGYGLNDSPAGLAAWIVEKFRTWSDCGGEVEKRFTKDELLTNVMIYWITNSITSSTRLYYETMKSGRFGPSTERVEQPTAGAIFPKELYRAPRAWAEKTFNIQQWTRMPSGGHFAALEEPVRLVEDVRSFFRKVRT